jgi:hypothetical protein
MHSHHLAFINSQGRGVAIGGEAMIADDRVSSDIQPIAVAIRERAISPQLFTKEAVEHEIIAKSVK